MVSFNHKLSTAILTGVLTLSTTAGAWAFTLNGTAGTWGATTGGQYVQYGTIGDETQVRWGLPYPSFDPNNFTAQSGLGFTGAGVTTLILGQAFQLGRLRHFNHPILGGTASSAVDLAISLFLAEIGEQQFNFTLEIDETPNVEGACPYFSVVPCSDKISWTHTFSGSQFSLDNTNYTLKLIGFSDTPDGPIVTDFISQEGGTSEVYFYGQIEEVPEPATLAGIALSIGGLGWMKRRRQKSTTP